MLSRYLGHAFPSPTLSLGEGIARRPKASGNSRVCFLCIQNLSFYKNVKSVLVLMVCSGAMLFRYIGHAFPVRRPCFPEPNSILGRRNCKEAEGLRQFSSLFLVYTKFELLQKCQKCFGANGLFWCHAFPIHWPCLPELNSIL